MASHSEAIEALAQNTVRIEPSDRVVERALVRDYDAWYASWEKDPDAFWDAAASELHWFERWSRTSRVSIPDHDWFVGGKTNLSYNCLERNIERGLGDKVAIYAESENDAPREITYRGALAEVSRIANALRSLGVGRGDRVIIYMPLSPEGLFTMQACARIGAVHSVVYAGMGADALSHRIEDSGARVVVCADKTYRRGNDYLGEAAKANSRTPFAHPEGFIEAFANVYLAAAQAISDQLDGVTPPAEGYDFPDATDGIAGLAFIETTVKSSASDQKWLKFPEL